MQYCSYIPLSSFVLIQKKATYLKFDEIEILEMKLRKKTKSNFFETKVSLEGRDECRPFIIILKKIYYGFYPELL